MFWKFLNALTGRTQSLIKSFDEELREANEGRDNIRRWANERIRTSDGGWTKDAMDCILYCMENRVPFDGIRMQCEYRELVVLGRECCLDTKDFKNKDELLERLEEDRAWIGEPVFNSLAKFVSEPVTA